ncbi:FAD-dependent oxidoreductase [Galbibacter sp. EGI 63066]|uniref:NAD(P)/FAD-dependent oxidoreductase n=1 Tax=Galbibacter sp. EGI 63066 TaxID=2993559 RepID=UPI002249A1A8|nr:FAD-dependent oxidoreductase [Galbibacter sp. EGI 63066]MCX2679989.1 FAD-dependent oxidoreductase [Galbibacter sp. EGI 63066]
MIDYIVVGVGLGGIAFCEQLEQHGKSYLVFDDDSQQSSNVAGGMYNPVILKRFTPVWRATEQLEVLIPFYSALEDKLSQKFNYKLPVLRRFVSVEEQNMWFEASDKPRLKPYLSTNMVRNTNKHIDAPLGYGEVLHTGRMDTDLLQRSYKKHLIVKGKLQQERFDYESLEVAESSITYQGITARNIVFCEGFGLKKNPFFDYLPLNGTKGELLLIKAPKLQLDVVVKSSVFIIPLGDHLYKVGATYKWKDKTNTPTEASKQELLEKLETFLKCDYEVVGHLAGIRPTVADRRPLVGQHPKHKSMYVLNGLGSRGVMIAPYVAKQLFKNIENKTPLEKEIDIDRYKKQF